MAPFKPPMQLGLEGNDAIMAIASNKALTRFSYGTDMVLKATVGARFSELVDNHEPSRYTPREYVSWHGFECYGHLPDGSYFGVGKIRDIDECWYDDFFLVDAEGRALAYAYEHFRRGAGMPDAVVASPSGKSIVWLVEGQLWTWLHNPKRGGFASFEGHQVHVPEDVAVVDARMNENGMADVWCADGRRYEYACDADALLAPGEWGPLLCTYPYSLDWYALECRTSCDAYIKACAEALPDIAGLLVCANAESFASTELPDGFREVRFSADCDCVESLMLAGAELERVVLSPGVNEVGQCAFAWNHALRELVIEGDASRIASWAADAFEGCPCEAEYLELRRKAQAE